MSKETLGDHLVDSLAKLEDRVKDIAERSPEEQEKMANETLAELDRLLALLKDDGGSP